MKRSTLYWASALWLSVASAFQDTSPFLLLSTSPHLQLDIPHIVDATSLSRSIESQLGSCPSDTYVLVSQPGATTLDYRNGVSMPQMRAKFLGREGKKGSSRAVENVLGNIDIESLSRLLQQKCNAGVTRVDASTGSFAIADEQKPQAMTIEFPALPTGPSRDKKMEEHDAFLASILDWLPSPDYSMIYTTTPSASAHHSTATEPEPYEMDTTFGAPVHMDLKRDFAAHPRAATNVTLPDGPLFARYQYFSPGLFVGFLVAILLSSLLYVGISAIASITVSYAAFDKEMGPAAQQKKQPQ